MASFREFFDKKIVRLLLAGFCFMMLSYGVGRIVQHQSHQEMVRGAGEILLWGGWCLVNFFHTFGRRIPKINILINIGLMIIVFSWFMPLMQR